MSVSLVPSPCGGCCIRDARLSSGAVSVADLKAFAQRHRDLADEEVMRSAWSWTKRLIDNGLRPDREATPSVDRTPRASAGLRRVNGGSVTPGG